VQLAQTRDELTDARFGLDDALDGDVATVLTMGALHAGHLALVHEARRRVGPGGSVIVTIFVNPLQFGAGEDLTRYPRTLRSDLQAAQDAGVDLVFAPSVQEMYPTELRVTVDPGELGAVLEGAARPGHFRGVLTVVAKLLNLTVPALTVFGEKDYQQLVLVRRMCADLELGVDVVGLPTVREPDGLALSSRNVYLGDQERAQALALSRALRAGQDAAHGGGQAALRAAGEVLAAEPGVEVDYLVLTDPQLQPPPEIGHARLLVAARVGRTRLLDNMPVHLGETRP